MRKSIPIILSILGVLALSFIDWYQARHWQREKASELNAAMIMYKTRLEGSITTRFDALESLSSLFVLHPDTTAEEFALFASKLLHFHPPIRALQYADSNTRVTYVYPPERNLITIREPMTLLKDPKRGPYTLKAIQEKKAVLQGPFELRQKGLGVVLRFPIFRDDNFIGLSIGVYDLNVLIEEAIKDLNLEKFAFRLENNEGALVWSSGDLVGDYQENSVSIADTSWVVQGSWLKNISRPFLPRFLIWFFGLGFVLISNLFLNFLLKEERRLEELVEKRTGELHKAEEKYRLAMEATTDGIWDWNIKTGEVYYSNSWLTILSEKTANPEYETWASKIHPEDKEDVLLSIRKHLEHETQYWTKEHRLKTGTGEWKWVLGRGRVVEKAPDGSPLRMVGTMSDISERKKSEEYQRQDEERLKGILLANPNPVVVYDVKGFPLFINPSFTGVFGWRLEEIQGKKIPFVPEEEKEISFAMIRKIYDTGKPLQFLTKRFTRTGIILDVNISAAVYKNSAGDNMGMVVNLTDITEQIKVEEQLRQALKMESVGRLAGGVAHDFNNMLSIILGNVELLMDDLGSSHPAFSNLQEILKAAKRSSNLTRQLLAFARKQTISPVVINLNSVIDGMIKMLRRLIGEDIDLSWKPQDELWPVEIDPSQIDQILANLCVNARDAIKDVGKIVIETDNVNIDSRFYGHQMDFKPGDYVVIKVSDNGSGMDRQTIDKLFEPFFTTKRSGEGTGLGLATVYGIVKQNNGFIDVYSQPDQGTTFKIYLPRHMADIVPEKQKTPEESHKQGSGVILLVEDEEAILEMTKALLERMGYIVLAAGTPEEALQISSTSDRKIDLLMTDVVMPKMNGRDLAETILKSFPEMKCLYMSGYTADVIAHRGILDEGVNFLSKPFLKKDLSSKLEEIFENSPQTPG